MRECKVNWVYIFGIEQRNKMNEFVFYKIFALLLAILLGVLTLEELAAKNYITHAEFNWPTASYALSLLLILFLPFDVCFREFRFELLFATY